MPLPLLIPVAGFIAKGIASAAVFIAAEAGLKAALSKDDKEAQLRAKQMLQKRNLLIVAGVVGGYLLLSSRKT